MNKRLFYVVTLLLAASGTALAADSAAERPPAQAGAGQYFQRLDTNGDGAISREEAQGHPRIEQAFEAMDADKDGKVTEAEFRAAMESYREQKGGDKGRAVKDRWSKVDANGDGAISRDEAAQGSPFVAKHFDEIDADKNGQITPQEIRDYIQSHRRQRNTN
jgi:Ca2+-binding EF-hand superfamily protein